MMHTIVHVLKHLWTT